MNIPKGWHIFYDPKPIPTKKHDFTFYHDDYDGAEDGNDNRAGTGETLQDCIDQIEEIENG